MKLDKPSNQPFRIGLHSYGWYTGHYQMVAGVQVEWVDGSSVPEGNEIRLLCTYKLQGRKIVWHATGSIQGNQLNLRYHHTANSLPPGWKSDGSISLVVSPDGNLLSGNARTLSGGHSFPISFNRME